MLLRQIAFSIGEDVLNEGTHHYIHRHRRANTHTSDFIEALALFAQLVMPVYTKEAMQLLRELQKSIPA